MAVRSPGYPPVSDIIGVSWGQISGKPATFPPAPHTHIIGDITGLQSALDGKLSSVSWSQVTDKPLTFAPVAHTHSISDVVGLQTALDSKLSSVSWSAVTNKPATFPPSAHTHVIGDVTGLQAALDTKLSTVSWPQVTGKPSTFPPSAHTHVIADVTGLQAALDAKAVVGNAAPKPLGTTTPGTSANASREDHVHPLPNGRWELIGNINVGEQLLVSLALGMKRKTFPLSGVTATDVLIAIPTAAPTAGCEVLNAYPASVGNVSIGYYTPALGVLATYSIPVAIYRVT